MVSKALFLYLFIRKKVFVLDGYDNDILLLMLDDDLFWVEDDKNVQVLPAKSGEG